jgi:hypothetical protein
MLGDQSAISCLWRFENKRPLHPSIRVSHGIPRRLLHTMKAYDSFGHGDPAINPRERARFNHDGHTPLITVSLHRGKRAFSGLLHHHSQI